MIIIKKAENGVNIIGGLYAPGDPPLRIVELSADEVREVSRATLQHRTRDQFINRAFMKCNCIGCQIYYASRGD